MIKYLIDSSAWLENFSGTQQGAQVESIIKEGDNSTTIAVIAELADKFSRENLDFRPFLEYIKGKATILPLTEEIALEAAKIKRTLRKTAPDASLIDAINLATAIKENAKLVTCDADFQNVKDVVLIRK